ncbi:uncharacterized protein Gasu_20420 [Galdieria sulphuraria]|uniref:Uncharacterized protein n=1 Tax=Galdieria sulphuraria TaxID=130081 RepID=M2X2G8_GALSU|nr:uncharacterized protein Gasu_20420 [Galdieria sulphuraria]EME30580.1 hypothetical protein Gasu_20420 [Galdieria sulphuraria]|eukprot:XP_005707100.1 hypothetical protein Gasu_20420 [Galdieria sulphuraria]
MMSKFIKLLHRLRRCQCRVLSPSVQISSSISWQRFCNRVYQLGTAHQVDFCTYSKKAVLDPGEEVEQLLLDLDNLSVEQKQNAFVLASKSAELGSSKGKLLMGCLLRCGIGTEQDEKKAMKVLEPLAEAGDAYASFLCGDILEQFYEETLSAASFTQELGQSNSINVTLNNERPEKEGTLKKAIRYYEKSVSSGNLDSLVALGNAWLKMQHPERAKEAYVKAAEKGIVSSFLCLGNLYFRGYIGKYSSVSRDGIKASKYLTAAAEEGSIEAKYLLGELYASGLEPIEPDESSALRYLESAAEQNHSEACYLLAKILLEKEELDPGSVNMEKILKFLLVAAEQNHAGACYFLADLYYKAGSSTSNNGLENYQHALTYFERSGASGLSEGYYMAALMYLHGVGTKVNIKVGIDLLNQAAEMGHTVALEKLSECYRYGQFGLEKCEKRADSLKKTASLLEER